MQVGEGPCAARTVRVYDLESGDMACQIEDRGIPLQGAFVLEGRGLILTMDGGVEVVDWRTGEVLETYVGPRRRTREAVISPDGRFVIASTLDGVLWVWERSSGRARQTWRGRMSHLEQIVVAPDSSWVVGVDRTGVVHLLPLDPVATGKAERPRDLRPSERKRFQIPESDAATRDRKGAE